MNSTPKKIKLLSAIYQFYDIIENEQNQFKCKACNCIVKIYGTTTSNLRKHLLTTKLEVHADAITQLSEMEKESPIAQRNAKRQRLEMTPQSPNLVAMGAVNLKPKFKYDHPRQLEW